MRTRPAGVLSLSVVSLALSVSFVQPAESTRVQSAVDSAGVRIVTYGELDRPAERWQVGEERFRLGGQQAKGPFQFWDVVGGLVLPDGRLVVADGGSQEIRFFDLHDHDPTHFFSIGGQGEGPGELESLWNLWLRRDSLVAVDGRRRSHLFSLGGAFGRSFPMPVSPVGTRMRLFGFLPDGGGLVVYSDPPTEPPQGRYQVFAHVARLSEGQVEDLLRVPGYVGIRKGTNRPTSLVFGPRVQVAVHATGFMVGNEDDFSISFFDSLGHLQSKVVHEDWPRRAITALDRELFFRGIEKANPGDLSYLARFQDRTEFAKFFPAFGRVVTGHRDQVWIGPMVPEQETLGTVNPPPKEPTTWAVFDSQGNWVSTVTLPAGFFLLSVGEDFVLGVERDELEMESIVAFGIR